MRPSIRTAGLIVGLIFGLMTTLLARGTTVTWDTSSCAPGTYAVAGTAIGLDGDVKTASVPAVQLPDPNFGLTFSPLFTQPYVIRATATGPNGTVSAQLQTVMGNDPMPTPTPSPSPTGTPTPSPTATPTPTTTPKPAAWTITSPAAGATISGKVTVSAPNPIPGSTAGFRVQLLTLPNTLVAQSPFLNPSPTDTVLTVVIDVTNVPAGAYVLRGSFSTVVTADVPVTVGPVAATTPTPTPTPTTTPTPPAGPTVAEVLAAVQAADAASQTKLTAIQQAIVDGFKGMQPQVVLPATCAIKIISIQAPLASGEYRITIGAMPGCLPVPAKGLTWLVIKQP